MKSYAQAGQDEWVHSIIGDSGYFVDIGAHDGVVHSNSYVLEQLGWDGVCVEPNPAACEQLWHNRQCAINASLISNHDGSMSFDGTRVAVGGWPVRCLRLCRLLELCDAPDVIDYLSVDVEGHELEVLDGMDFDRWHVRLLTVEHNLYCDGPDRKNAIYDRLTAHGFKRVREDVIAEGYGPYEDWWRCGEIT